MSEKTDKQQAIFAAIAKLKDQLADGQCVIDFLHQDIWELTEELNAAIVRAQQFEEEVIRFRDELSHIANAKPIDYQSFTEFAQSRARHALGQEAGTLTIKRAQ